MKTRFVGAASTRLVVQEVVEGLHTFVSELVQNQRSSQLHNAVQKRILKQHNKKETLSHLRRSEIHQKDIRRRACSSGSKEPDILHKNVCR